VVRFGEHQARRIHMGRAPVHVVQEADSE
jgi:hypothetical protein